jgi:hypothetical protein
MSLPGSGAEGIDQDETSYQHHPENVKKIFQKFGLTSLHEEMALIDDKTSHEYRS